MNLEFSIYKKLHSFDLDVSMKVGDECVGLMGPSGSGKSMTLKCIAGIETPDRGKICINNQIVFDSEQGINLRPQERNVGYLFQNYALFDHMSVEQNIETGLKAHGYTKEEQKKKMEEMTNIFQLEDIRKRHPRQLSGGQKQRVALARLLAYSPEIVLLDEPFSALDSDLKEELQQELGNILRRYQKPSILVSHDQNEVERLCNRRYSICKGEIRYE